MQDTHAQIHLYACSEHLARRHLRVFYIRDTPKSSILIGFSITNHPSWGTPISPEPPICFVARLPRKLPGPHRRSRSAYDFAGGWRHCRAGRKSQGAPGGWRPWGAVKAWLCEVVAIAQLVNIIPIAGVYGRYMLTNFGVMLMELELQ